MPPNDEHTDRREPHGLPLTPPRWAAHSTPEDGGIVHETLSPVHPTITSPVDANGEELMPACVLLTATDVRIDGEWVRTRPNISIEGGRYTLDGARKLRAVIDAFLDAVTRDATIRLSEVF